MNSFAKTAIIAAALGVVGSASAAVDMNQTDAFTGLVSTPTFGVNQRFEAANAAFSGALIDDFTASATNINEVRAAFEETQAGNHTLVTNWHLSIWSSVAAASASGTNLTGDVINADLGIAGAVYNTSLTGAGGTNPTQVSFTGLNISGLTAGTTYWMGLIPDLAFTGGGQQFLLSNTTPTLLGAGTNNSSTGINPGGGFGVGNPVVVNSNAALYIRTGAAVPEPASIAVLGLGALALIRRRRSNKA